jgi:5-methyltetrahydropteroyltriglutamate--homocysteine methyltransferase
MRRSIGSGEAAILDQEIAGIDVITGGEMHRRTHNRPSPPNAMLNYFWQKLPAFQGSTRPKPIAPYDPNVYHPAAACRAASSRTSIWVLSMNSKWCLH